MTLIILPTLKSEEPIFSFERWIFRNRAVSNYWVLLTKKVIKQSVMNRFDIEKIQHWHMEQITDYKDNKFSCCKKIPSYHLYSWYRFSCQCFRSIISFWFTQCFTGFLLRVLLIFQITKCLIKTCPPVEYLFLFLVFIITLLLLFTWSSLEHKDEILKTRLPILLLTSGKFKGVS